MTIETQSLDPAKQAALVRDARDSMAPLRERFVIPESKIYLLGNSLGLMSRDAEQALAHALDQWKRLGVDGWLHGDPPWLHMAEMLGEQCASLVGARSDEVVATGTTTVNIHSLVSTLYQPRDGRTRILADELNFPSDIYALSGQLGTRGLDPAEHLVLVASEDGQTLDEDRIIEMMTDDVALVHLPAVVFRSGQLLDVERIASAARRRGIVVGIDCCHSVGILPHRLDDWDVDYAVWCSYKYLNAGPGATGFLYLNRRHFHRVPAMPGWFGFVKDRQFDMELEFEHQPSAGGFQISSPTILGAAPLIGSLGLIHEAGLENIRRKSVEMTTYLIDLVEGIEGGGPFGVRVGTPTDPSRRGGHVALESERAGDLYESLTDAGIVVDFRTPNTIRLAPSPLYNTFHELWNVATHLATGRGINPPAG